MRPIPIDRLSSRPDYLVLVYGVGRATPGESLKNFPPTFLVSAAADTGPAMGNAQLFMDLTRAGATAEIHVYQKGRHGFGSGFGSPEFSDWMGAPGAVPEAGRIPAGGQLGCVVRCLPVCSVLLAALVLMSAPAGAPAGGQ